MITRSKVAMSTTTNPSPPHPSAPHPTPPNPVVVAADTVEERDRVGESKARTVTTHSSSRSSATVRARKADVEAQMLRKQLQREQELARKEQERDRQLAALQKAVEQSELEAELAHIDATAASNRGSSLRSYERTQAWVHDLADRPDNVEPCCSVLPPQHTEFMPPTAAPKVTTPPFVTDEKFFNTQNIIPHSIFQTIADTAAAAKALACSQGKPKTADLCQFSGDPLQWLHFKRIYDYTKTFFSPFENIGRLQNALRGPAREAVASVLLSAEDPEDIIRALEGNFARPELIVFKEVSALKNLPRLGQDLKELGTIANKVRNSIYTIRLLQVEYLYSPELFHAVLGKLNANIKARWTDFAIQDTSNRPKLEILSDYLQSEWDRHVKYALSPENIITPVQSTTYSRDKHSGTYAHAIQTNPSNNSLMDRTATKECVFCRKGHNIKTCADFKLFTVDERWRWLREQKVCYRCLRNSPHQWKTCKVNPCGVDNCTSRHHPLLHGRQAISQYNVATIVSSADPVGNESVLDQPVDRVDVSVSTMQQAAHSSKTFLKIIPVTISGPSGTVDTFALLDDGSTATLICSSVSSLIGVGGTTKSLTVNCVGGLSKTIKSSLVDFNIKGKNSNEVFLVKNASSIESLCLRPQTICKDELSSYAHLQGLVDDLSYANATPTVLIGADQWHLSISREVRKGSRNQPLACLTALGWVLYGRSSSRAKVVDFVNHLNIDSKDESLEFLIKEQYKLDSVGICKQQSMHNKQEQRAIDIVESTLRRLPTGRFEVGLPWNDNVTHIPDSHAQALSRFLSLERRMDRETDFANAYTTFINNMLDKKYAEECDIETYYGNPTYELKVSNKVRWYLPHFGVYHPQKRKLRVVHDAAAINQGVSLNSMLLPGPDLLQPLLHILFRFREGRVALTADIKEMFPQFRVRQEDRDALRFLWRPRNTGTEKQPIKEYRMTAVIFGACSSPFISQYLKNKNAKDFEHLYPRAVDGILYNHYVDDYLDSHDSCEEAAQIAADIIAIHSAACLEMREWISNDRAALHLVPTELRAAQSLEIDLSSKNNATVKVLGIIWDPTSDHLGFRTGLDSLPESLTKRIVLSHLMRVYDPLGMLAPIIVKGRILFQNQWRSNASWDTQLSSSEVSRWFEWFQELSKVAAIRIPRWYCSSNNLEPIYRELHVFSDASELAYACVAYWRLVYADGFIRLALISSKARVTPLKPTSIPRLELQAALIASRLAITIKNSHKKVSTRTVFWTDSMTVLGWLRSDARTFKPFVAHRIGEISENTSVKDWKWVPTGLNVADDATRLKPINLTAEHRWFLGPSFLLKPCDNWPVEPTGQPPVREELKQAAEPMAVHWVVTADFSHFNKWSRLVRSTARVLQVVAKFRTILERLRKPDSNTTAERRNRRAVTSASTTLIPLTAELMDAAEAQIWQRVQSETFAEEIQCLESGQPIKKSSRLAKLSPVMGTDKLLRLVGRIRAVQDIDPSSKFPILLDSQHPAVHLLVQHYHRIAGHANNQMVINEIRQKYWLLRLRNTVRTVANKCLFCRIRKATPLSPMTGDLPVERLAHHRRPFTFTGLDYFGPVSVTIGRRREKRWVALFTCMTTRAIHLDVVNSLTADSAIMALRRFIARRGTPTTVFSDNGTCFVGANRILKVFYEDTVQDFAANKGIKWSFIPAAAPSFGGCWERLVRSVKTALKVTLFERAPREETFLTLLLEAEALVNSRPLSHVSVDINDDESLTPFHFLIGSSSHQALPEVLTDRDLTGRAEWRKALRLADHFWSRWIKEILPTLQPRQIGTNTQPNLRTGDLVLIVDENLPRGFWPRGRITAVYPGKDGVVRVVDVKTQAGVLRRPTKKIVRLEVNN